MLTHLDAFITSLFAAIGSVIKWGIVLCILGVCFIAIIWALIPTWLLITLWN